jgi:hypothetical protein
MRPEVLGDLNRRDTDGSGRAIDGYAVSCREPSVAEVPQNGHPPKLSAWFFV